MLFIFSTPVLIRHLWQLNTVVYPHWCIILCGSIKINYFWTYFIFSWHGFDTRHFPSLRIFSPGGSDVNRGVILELVSTLKKSFFPIVIANPLKKLVFVFGKLRMCSIFFLPSSIAQRSKRVKGIGLGKSHSPQSSTIGGSG